MRNPFTSVTNLAFLRNNAHVSPAAKQAFRPRSHSGSKYFEYKPSCLRDDYLFHYDSRRQQ